MHRDYIIINNNNYSLEYYDSLIKWKIVNFKIVQKYKLNYRNGANYDQYFNHCFEKKYIKLN